MKVENSNDQLSGLGFFSTQRNSIVARVEGILAKKQDDADNNLTEKELKKKIKDLS